MDFLNFLNPQLFDALVLVVFGLGSLAAVFRLYQDFTRPLDDEDDTQPHR